MCSMHLLDFKINEFKQMSLYPVCFDRSGKWTSDHILFKGTQLEGADPVITVDKFTLKAESQPLCWGLLSLDPHSRLPLTGFLFWGLLHRTFQSRSRPRRIQTLHTNTCAEINPFHLLPSMPNLSFTRATTALTGLLGDTYNATLTAFLRTPGFQIKDHWQMQCMGH